MKILRSGSRGPQVQLLQLALKRAGQDPGDLDGYFGVRTRRALEAFQLAGGLAPDGIAGPKTHRALEPWYTGYLVRRIRPGDSFYRLAQRFGSTLSALETANPALDPLALPVGGTVTIPLGFDVVPVEIDWCSELLRFCCDGLAARYPRIGLDAVGSSELGTPLWLLTLGSGPLRVLWNGTHHANEWITTPLLMLALERIARAEAFGQPLAGADPAALLRGASLSVVPCVNPDGMDLVTGDLDGSSAFAEAAGIAAAYPGIPFPAGWKANIRGTDPNLQYPAGWEQAREIKFAQGYTRPAPRDYVGAAPLEARESRALYEFTRAITPDRTLSYHTQGQVIFWKYLEMEPPGGRELALRFSAASGYAVENVPFASGFAGYKDWFILDYDRPGFTIEAGAGDNPLPLSALEPLYRENIGLLLESLR